MLKTIVCRSNLIQKLTSVHISRNVSIDKKSEQEVTLSNFAGAKDDQILLLGLNRGFAKNALSKSLSDQFLFRLDQVFANHPDSRVLILHSHVKGIFCGGADLKERLQMSSDQVEPLVDQFRLIGQRLAELPIPTIAALDGIALGGGLEMALACDLRVAANTSKMGLVETRLAIIPGAGGSQRLPRLIGVSRAKQLIYTAEVLDGTKAEQIGLVNQVVPQNESGDAAFQASVELAKRLVKQGPKALRMAKLAIDQGIQVSLGTGLAIEKAAYAQLIPTNDRLEGLKAFVEKRVPEYKGN